MALRNFTRNLRIFLDSLELWIENKKNILGKTVLKIWSQICGKNTMLVQKITLKKVQKSKNTQNIKNLKLHFFFKAIFLDISGHFAPNLKPHFKTVFPKLFFFLFKAQHCLETIFLTKVFSFFSCLSLIWQSAPGQSRGAEGRT